MTDRLVIVTGSLGTIGSAVAERLLSEGYKVVGLDRRASAEVAWPIKVCQVGDETQVFEQVAAIHEEYGPIYGLVNVAGVLARGGIESTSVETFIDTWQVNTLGTFLVCKAVVAAMGDQKDGAIVNIGSLVAKNSGNARPWIDPSEVDRVGGIAYASSKAAVHTLTTFMARELAPKGIRVNSVAPGPVATAMTTEFPENLRAQIPLARMATGAEVAGVVAFLFSDDAGFISGEILDVNGAMWCD